MDLTQASAAGSGTAGGGADPVSAIANALGDLFGMFGQLSATQQTIRGGELALLLESQPKRIEKRQDLTPIFVFAAAAIFLLVLLFLTRKKA